METAGTAYLCTFPFWLFVDGRSPLRTTDIPVDNTLLRFYPPFRSGVANHIPMPWVSVHEIPFLAGRKPSGFDQMQLFQVAALPRWPGTTEEGASLRINWGPEWQTTPDPFPMDSVRFDHINRGQQSAENPRLHLRRLLDSLRCQSRQWWIGQSTHPMLGFVRNTFPIDQFGAPKNEPAGDISGRTMKGDEKGIDEAIWDDAIDDVRNQRDRPLYESLYLDGRYFAAQSAYRRAIIDYATACENAIEVHCERIWRQRWPTAAYKRSYLFPSYDLIRNLRNVEERLRISFQDAHDGHSQWLERLWLARGRVAHGKKTAYPSGGALHMVTDEDMKEFESVADVFIEWLKQI